MLHESLDTNDLKILSREGFEIKEQAVNGDYEIYLCYNNFLNMFQLAFQRSGYHFTSIEQQLEKHQTGRGHGSINEMKNIILNWLEKYHKIYFGSMDERKNKAWFRILTKLGFKIKSYYNVFYIED
jgi:hypothetical protein